MKIYLFSLFLCFAFVLYAKDNKQSADNFSKDKLMNSDYILSCNQQKFQLIQESTDTLQGADKAEQQKKSGFKAALFSAIIPGAGEFYSESYWKSAVFAVVEIAAWAGYLTYEDKGDTKDLQMRRLGDERWSEQRYWTRVYMLASSNWQGGNVQFEADPESGVNVLSEASIEDNINYLRDLEAGRTDAFPNGFTSFTHTLPETKTQQYYEMIYKYLGQFGAGWVELGDNWMYYDGGANLDNLTPDVNQYRTLRNKSNDFYATAKAMTTVVLFNHLISAFDAAFSVRNYNKKLSYSVYAGQRRYAGENVTTYGLALSW